MISFDIESLFTNVPLDETIKIVISKLFKNKDSRVEGLKSFQFERLLRTATQESHFYFRGNYFNQIDSVSMGSPLAPTLANIFVSELENKIMSELGKKGVVTWMRYVDDTFAIVESKDRVSDILNFLNVQHKNIKFTYECEENFFISFLDVRVKRTETGFLTDVYRKKTFTGSYLHWNSLTTTQYKTGLIKCLLDRSWKICSNLDLFHKEIQNLKLILLKNEYPITILNKEIKRFLRDKFEPRLNYRVKGKPVFLVLPYGGEKTDELKRRLNSLINKFYPQIEFNLMFKTPKTIGNFFNFKDKTPQHLRSKVVYKVSCSDCDGFYIGKTCRNLITRIEEHKVGKNSSVSEHVQQNGHTMNWKDIEILDHAKSDMQILWKEMLHIKKQKPMLNKQLNSELFCLLIGQN